MHFHTNFLDYTLDVILNDSVIRNEEVYTIDSSICYFNDTYNDKDKLEKLATFIDTLQKVNTNFYGAAFTLNNNASLLFSIVKDRLIDSADLYRIAERNELQLLDTLWYSDLFSDRYFNTKKDTLTSKERLKIDVTFDSSIHKTNVHFCNDLQQLIEKIKIDIDSTDFKSDYLQIVLQQDSCEVSIK